MQAEREHCEQTFERHRRRTRFNFGLARRADERWNLGETAKKSQPFIKQIFIGKTEKITDNAHFERKLYVMRRWAKELLTRENADFDEQFYFASLSTKTIIYKGMLTTHQLVVVLS